MVDSRWTKSVYINRYLNLKLWFLYEKDEKNMKRAGTGIGPYKNRNFLYHLLSLVSTI